MTRSLDSLADTIVACATPPGEGAIAVLRLSGPEARSIAARVAPRPQPIRSHRMVACRVVDEEQRTLDEALVVEMHAPRSYTGEDIVEIQLHGARAVVDAVLETCRKLGARLARPGEYTLRAFLHGRMDLAQAESVGDLIASRNEEQRQVAADNLEGRLSGQVEGVLEGLEAVLADARAALDFPEHPTGEGLGADHVVRVSETACKIQQLVDGARVGLRSGLRVVLCGAPNVGKSTLLNRWAGRERVLVDEAPGTTRDPVEVDLSGGLVRWSVWDTAGIRNDAEGVEARGIEMSRDQIRQADVALWLVDPLDPQWPSDGLTVQLVGSKADLADESSRKQLEEQARQRNLTLSAWVAPQVGEGVEALRRRLLERFDAPLPEGIAVAVRQRHVEALQTAHSALVRCLEGAKSGLTLDVLALEIELAAKALGEILGRNVDAEVLDRIFSEFCIGK